MKKYSIFGAGAAGLYTAWRLLEGKLKDPKFKDKQLNAGDVLELYDWGKYDFSKANPGSRAAGSRICTWHYDNDKSQSYVELGGMRYSFWNQQTTDGEPCPNGGHAPGHRVVTKTIEKLGLNKYSVPFNVTNNQLFYLRSKNFYLNDINSNNPAPYNINNFGAGASADQAFTILENLGIPDEIKNAGGFSRLQWCNFYKEGHIIKKQPDSSVFKEGDLLKDIGYWNLLYDQVGSEGYDYAADGNGYSSNIINTNTAVSMNMNDEFTPGSQYKTLSIGYSGMFNALFDEIVKLCKQHKIEFRYYPDTRLHSILWKKSKAVFTYATRKNPNIAEGTREADAAWLAMPRAAIDMVAQATRYSKPAKDELDVLNHEKVNLYLESTIMQPSYKVGMFFDIPWWTGETVQYYLITETAIENLEKLPTIFPANFIAAMKKLMASAPYYRTLEDLMNAINSITKVSWTYEQKFQLSITTLKTNNNPATYPALITGYVITTGVIKQLSKFPPKITQAMQTLIDVPYSALQDLVSAVENAANESLTFAQTTQLATAATRNTIGPSVTNSPIRMVVYFGNNATGEGKRPIYGILASYDDMDNTTFWQELELGAKTERTVPISSDTQPLEGPRKVPTRMVKMLRKMLAELHYGPNSDYSNIPEPLDAKYMDWSLPPFNAGYHEWAPHYNVGDVQRKIRKPSQLIDKADADIFIVGEAYSNDQAWVEGAYCTAESVLNDFFGIEPIINNKEYPFICPEL
ncbi:MAG: hypothetical protein ACKO1T_01555 [Sediminibacterium sp.]